MLRKPIFPVLEIEKNSHIIMYGAGENGKKLYKLNKELEWCDIFLTVDRGFSNINDFPTEVVSPEEIKERNYDYVLVSIVAKEIRDDVVAYLLSIGVDRSKIISFIDTYYQREDYEYVVDNVEKTDDQSELKIAYYSWGILGDNVINLKLYQEIVKLAPNSEITVFSDHYYFTEKIFYGQKNLKRVIDGEPDSRRYKDYDLILEVRFEPQLLHYNRERVKKINPVLCKKMDILFDYQKKDFVDMPLAQYGNRVLLERARMRGWNRYTLFGASGAFDIKDSRVDVYIDTSFEEDFHKLKLPGRYITYNFGANNPWPTERRQTKMWPYEYHCELNNLFKRSFPDIEIVQLGGKRVTKIPGADRYILGEDIEVTKYVLKNSLLHIDCEGGLVHLASQLGTKCLVYFGPTPSWFLGYEKNINIDPVVCGECKGLVKDWYTRCYLYDRPECMYSITPNYVMKKIEEYLNERFINVAG